MRDLGLSYEQALHGMQTAVDFEHSSGSPDGTPKHLRVGVNSAHITNHALVAILIEKGVFTAEEFDEKLRLAANEEVATYEQRYTGIHFR